VARAYGALVKRVLQRIRVSPAGTKALGQSVIKSIKDQQAIRRSKGLRFVESEWGVEQAVREISDVDRVARKKSIARNMRKTYKRSPHARVGKYLKRMGADEIPY
jgi:hypothetical protein